MGGPGPALALLVLSALLCLPVDAARPTFGDPVRRALLTDALAAKKYHWALLIAGSQGWWNYRHQADVCHAYQVLKANGLADDHIIVMVYDDIANNENNPYPGQIFNKPGGADVYPGCAKDYTGLDINPQTVLSVLSGDAAAVAGRGSGRVVNSTASDRVFVYYSDHGSDGILGMPSGDFIYADSLNATLNAMARANAFKQLVMYIEACESASMFQGILDPHMGVYVVTASDPFESSWATYCPDPLGLAEPQAPVEPNASALGVCMGDLFSVAWMEDTEEESIFDETLRSQYAIVRSRTSANGTFSFGSHAMQFGEESLADYPVGDFLGPYALPKKASGGEYLRNRVGEHRRQSGWINGPQASGWINVPQRDGLLVHLMIRAARAEANGESGASALAEMRSAIEARDRVDAAVRNTVRNLVAAGSLASSGSSGVGLSEEAVATFVSEPMGRPGGGLPLVDDWGCLRAMVGAWTGACGPMDDYAMKHTRAFANLCNAGVNPGDFAAAAGSSGCRGPVAEDAVLTT
eukprot:evm.model.scf_42.13 EVM.evm.TU.scf_42.13   scf_42:87319-91346(+)